ncbi:MAG TPA: helix-turn-helix domain-containing protein [Acidobacteriota bacterium]|nr:helix-turn-helix domain-containing protein [Acidobacteriota bacterium]
MRSTGAINNYVAHRLREIRTAKKLSSQEVARRTGIATGSYSCLENGWYRINLDNLFKILHALDTEVTEVWPRPKDEGQDGPIDEDYLKKTVRKALDEGPREMELDDVLDSVCEAFGVGKGQLQSKMRSWARLSQARAACGLLVKESPSLSLTDLCGLLGCSLSSMSHLMRRHMDALDEGGEMGETMERARRALRERLTRNKGQEAEDAELVQKAG